MREEIDWTKRAEGILTGLRVPIWGGNVRMLAESLHGVYQEGKVMGHCPECRTQPSRYANLSPDVSFVECPGCGHEGEIRALKAELENVQAGNRVLQREIAKVAEHFGMPGDGRLLSEQWIEAYEKVNKERDRANEIAEDLLEALRTG